MVDKIINHSPSIVNFQLKGYILSQYEETHQNNKLSTGQNEFLYVMQSPSVSPFQL